jgi:hypothetical protein
VSSALRRDSSPSVPFLVTLSGKLFSLPKSQNWALEHSSQ